MTIISILNHFDLISEFVKWSKVHFLVSRHIKKLKESYENGLSKYGRIVHLIVNIVIDVDKHMLDFGLKKLLA